MKTTLLLLTTFILAGCTAEEFDHIVTATGRAVNDGLSARDRYEHPERYTPHTMVGYDAYGRPIFQ